MMDIGADVHIIPISGMDWFDVTCSDTEHIRMIQDHIESRLRQEYLKTAEIEPSDLSVERIERWVRGPDDEGFAAAGVTIWFRPVTKVL